MRNRGSRRRAPGLVERTRGAVRALRAPAPADDEASPDSVDVAEMLGEIAVTLLAASQATSDVESTIKQLAAQYGRPDLRVFVLPTLVLIEDPRQTPSKTSVFAADRPSLRLDQSGEVEQVVRRAFRAQQDPQTVVDALTKISLRGPRFGAVVTILGHALLAAGFGLMLNPTLTALPVYVVLGALVGALVLLGNRMSALALILPVAAAFIVTTLVALLAHPVVHDDIIRLVAPPLVSLFPGLPLTIAAVELTSGEVIAGASRLVYGVARLGLLSFGLYAGLTVAGPVASSTDPSEPLGAWAPWAGVMLVSIGYYLFSGAPRGSLLWIVYALVVAYSAQLLGHLLVGGELSGFFGALIVIPAVHLVTRLKSAPSSSIMLTCAYWLLVPGSMGFISLSEAASGQSGAATAMLQTAGSLLAIAIGMMLGAALTRDLSAVARGWKAPRNSRVPQAGSKTE